MYSSKFREHEQVTYITMHIKVFPFRPIYSVYSNFLLGTYYVASNQERLIMARVQYILSSMFTNKVATKPKDPLIAPSMAILGSTKTALKFKFEI